MAEKRASWLLVPHPIEDEHLAHAIEDVATNGRNSETYQRAVLGYSVRGS
jgi:hypothetical protein